MVNNNTDSIFDKVFNRTYEVIKSEDGIEPIRIDSSSIANIPGVIRHWREEIAKRKKDILEYENRHFFERFFDWITDDEDTDDPSGDEIYKIAPTREAKDLMEKIEDDPTDMTNRLDLVAHILKNGQITTIEAARDLYLQGIVACCFGELSGSGLLACLRAQEIYFGLLLKRCNFDLEKIKKILTMPAKDDLYARQKQLHIDFRNRINQNIQLIESYLKHTTNGIESTSGKSGIELSIAELHKDLKNHAASDKSRKKEIYDKATKLLSIIKFLPLLHEEGMKFLNLLIRLDHDHPLPFLLKARILRTKLVFLMKQRQAGDLDTELVRLIKGRFLQTYGVYENTVKAKKLNLDGELMKLSHLELARLIIDCRSFFKEFLNRELPGQTPEFYQKKARKLLDYLGKNKVAKELLEKLDSWDESE